MKKLDNAISNVSDKLANLIDELSERFFLTPCSELLDEETRPETYVGVDGNGQNYDVFVWYGCKESTPVLFTDLPPNEQLRLLELGGIDAIRQAVENSQSELADRLNAAVE